MLGQEEPCVQGVLPAFLEEMMEWWLLPGGKGYKSEIVGLATPDSNEQIHS